MKALISSLLTLALASGVVPVPAWGQVRVVVLAPAAQGVPGAAAGSMMLSPARGLRSGLSGAASLSLTSSGLGTIGAVSPALRAGVQTGLGPSAGTAAAPSGPRKISPRVSALSFPEGPAAGKAAVGHGRAAAMTGGLAVLRTAGKALGKSADVRRRGTALDSLFTGTRGRAAAPVPVPAAGLGRVLGPGRSTLDRARGIHLPMSAEPAVEAVIAHAETGRKPVKEKAKLPRSYYLYLASQLLYALGQESATLIIPLYAYFSQGLAFAVGAQALGLLAIIPGSFLGAWVVRALGAKRVYFAGNLLHALFFISIPVAHLLFGGVSPLHFLAFKAVSGVIYGTLRGVAEKEIAPRLLGQDDQGRLKKAGSMFYAVFELAEFVSAIATGLLIASMGMNGASAVMAVLMLTSVIPILKMKLGAGPAKGEEGGGTETKLPYMMYLPFVFALFFHLCFYEFLAPFMALEVFQLEAFSAQMIAAYTIGSLAVALFSTYLPKAARKLNEKGWSVFGAVSALAFLWGGLLGGSSWLALGLAFVMGVGLTGLQIQWRAVFQRRLSLKVQPKVFKWLMIAGVLASLLPFAAAQGGLFFAEAVPMKTLLLWIAAGITAGSVLVPVAVRLREKPLGVVAEPPGRRVPAPSRRNFASAGVSLDEARAILADLVRRAGMRRVPKLSAVPSRRVNAAAHNASRMIEVTTGLLASLNAAEVEAVLAHELGHLHHGVRRVLASVVVLPLLVKAAVLGGFWFLFPWNVMAGGLLATLALFWGVVRYYAREEFAADDFAKRLLGSGRPLAEVLAKLPGSASDPQVPGRIERLNSRP